LRGVLLGISAAKDKWYVFGGKHVRHTFRYLSFFDYESKQRFLIRMTDKAFFDLKNSEGLLVNNPDTGDVRLRSGDVVNVEHYTVGDKPLEDGTRMLFNPKIFSVLGHEDKELTKRYELSQITFYDWGVILRDEDSKTVIESDMWNQMTNLETTWRLNKLKSKLSLDESKESFVEITAKYRVYYRRWNHDMPFYYSNGDWRITSENLLPLKKIVVEDETARKMRNFIRNIKEVIKSRFVISDQDILEVLKKVKLVMDIKEARDYVRNAVWKGRYEEEYFDFLKGKAKEIRVAYEGFLFVLPKSLVILEEPEYAKATYVFVGEVNDVVSKLVGIRQADDTGKWKEELLKFKREIPEKFNWFLDRIIHYDFDGWKENLEKVIDYEQVEPFRGSAI